MSSTFLFSYLVLPWSRNVASPASIFKSLSGLLVCFSYVLPMAFFPCVSRHLHICAAHFALKWIRSSPWGWGKAPSSWEHFTGFLWTNSWCGLQTLLWVSLGCNSFEITGVFRGDVFLPTLLSAEDFLQTLGTGAYIVAMVLPLAHLHTDILTHGPVCFRVLHLTSYFGKTQGLAFFPLCPWGCENCNLSSSVLGKCFQHKNGSMFCSPFWISAFLWIWDW